MFPTQTASQNYKVIHGYHVTWACSLFGKSCCTPDGVFVRAELLQLSLTLRPHGTVALQASLSVGFPRKEY